MIAAIVAGLAFGSLALSELSAVGQLGILCGAGEVLTAVAILLVTPEIGAWLERKPRREPPKQARDPAWIRGALWLTGTKKRAAITFAASLVPAALVAI